ncbi:hypothetical protein LO762_22610 [Actinocorallia sp. API 0066]|uniref:hypothetical protein n=1 Tax=Actinocorallia sp. API 0066 TaxID=2896846 RepID=UPI001E5832F7|nr:hypothetical protein [Actinocorallia sp. API 0066]MCD0451964.1 hypothetical protein [Actinocorallia sp. API 0066]
MRELNETIQQRLKEAYASLQAATRDGDTYLADLRQSEIDELRRIADNHDLPTR